MKSLKCEPPNDAWKRFAFSRSVMLNDCPKCKQVKEYFCIRPNGRKAWPPHRERLTKETAASCIIGHL